MTGKKELRVEVIRTHIERAKFLLKNSQLEHLVLVGLRHEHPALFEGKTFNPETFFEQKADCWEIMLRWDFEQEKQAKPVDTPQESK